MISRTALYRSALFLACACGSTPAAVTPPPPPPPPPDPDAEIHALNQAAAQAGTEETLHGVLIEDPFRTLEQESEFTNRWVTAQNDRTQHALTTDEPTRARLDQLLSIGSISGLHLAGDRLFYSKREGEQEQPILFVQVEGEERALLDPTSLGERAAIDWYYPSTDGRLVAYGVSTNGSERSTLRVLDVDSGEHRDEAIGGTKWCNLAWLPEGEGFYYTRYPREGEPGFDPEQPDNYFPRIFFHRMGADADQDPLVFGGERGTDFPSPHVSSDGRYVTINVFRGWSESDVLLFDRGARRRKDVPGPRDMRTVVAGLPHMTTGRVHDGQLYLTTNVDAPKNRVMRVSPARPTQNRWQEVIPEHDAPLESWQFSAQGLVAHYLDDVRSKLVLINDGVEQEVALPELGAVRSLAAEHSSDTVAFVFESYLRPPTVFTWEGDNTEELARVTSDFDRSGYEVTRERVESADGTMVPVTLIHSRGLERDGTAPVLLYGYGGFNISLMPRFTRHSILWLERGGVYAIANLRGGGEFGEEWHRAGALANKPRVFEDFEAIIAWLSTSQISNPRRIAITGGSNGGLLMGAMITRVPDTFAAAASYVGLYDMLRYHRFPPAELWISEYGSAEDAELFPVLHGYSPYHQVTPSSYPAALIETADHDGRVHWAHSTKFVAALQEATTSEHPIYFYMERAQGHGAGARRTDQVERYARMYTFLSEQLQVETP